MKFYLATFLLLILGTVQNSYADVEMSLVQPDEGKLGQSLPAISFLNEDDQKVSFASSDESKPFLFVPFYTHCKSTCPLNVSHLKDVLKATDEKAVKVVLFSFASDDTSRDLKDFRRALQVPASWSILRASPKDTNTLLETLDFRYMTQGVDFIHSNTIVVISPGLKIVKFIQGLGYTARTIDLAVRDAKRFKDTALPSIPFLAIFFMILLLAGVAFWAKNESRDMRHDPNFRRLS